MNKFYPITDDKKQETVWNFLLNRDVRAMAHKKAAVSKRAKLAINVIEAAMKEKK